jgi:hypothetical protein
MATRPPIKTARMRDKSGRFIRHAEIRTTNTDILSLKDAGNRKALIRLDIPDDPFGIKYIAGPSPPDTDIDAAIEAFRPGYSRHYRLYLKFSGQIDGTVTCPAATVTDRLESIGSGSYNTVYAFGDDKLIRVSTPIPLIETNDDIKRSAKNALKASVLGIGPEIYDINFTCDRRVEMTMERYTSNLGEFLYRFKDRSGVYTTPGNPGPSPANAAAEEYLQTRTVRILYLMALNNLFCIDIKPGNMVLKYNMYKTRIKDDDNYVYTIEKFVGIDFDYDFCDDDNLRTELSFRSMLLLFGYHLFNHEYNYLDIAINQYISKTITMPASTLQGVAILPDNTIENNLYNIVRFLFPPITQTGSIWQGLRNEIYPPQDINVGNMREINITVHNRFLSIIMLLTYTDIKGDAKKLVKIVPPTTRRDFVGQLCHYFRDYSLPVLFLFWFPFLRNKNMFLHDSPESTASNIGDVYSHIGVDIIVPPAPLYSRSNPFYNSLVTRSECIERVKSIPIHPKIDQPNEWPILIVGNICDSANELAPNVSLGKRIRDIPEQVREIFARRGGQSTRRKKRKQTKRINRARLSHRRTKKTLRTRK